MNHSCLSPRRPCLAIYAFISSICLLAAAPAWSFGLAGPLPVVEFYNSFLGHYFMTLDVAEIADIEAGKAGPGWVRTGWSFAANPAPVPANASCPNGCGVEVSRFYGTPGLGPNSHFYTADAAEAAGLDRPGTGWTFEGKAFTVPVPDSAGNCAAGVPVYRLYNQRWMFNDSNHRYVTSPAERARMQALGWADEGVRFCAFFASTTPIRSFLMNPVRVPAKILPSSQCEDESVNIGPCIAVNNLPTPNAPFAVPPPIAPGAVPGYEFFDRTGMSTATAYVVNASLPPQYAASDVFVQNTDSAIGIHVDTLNRGASPLSSVNPLYQFHNAAGPGLRDDRFFPFAGYESEVELAISFHLGVKRVRLRNASSAAYGHPTLEFVDQRSGHHVYFTVLAYGTVPSDNEYLAVDSGTGKVIVGTAFRANSPYGRSLRDSVLSTPSGFEAVNYSDGNRDFEFRVSRVEFQRVLQSARTLDPALSANAADYLVDNFHFNNEVAGDGEIGLVLQNYQLNLLRR